MIPELKIFIVAGEASGDRLGAALMEGLIKIHGHSIVFEGVGGPLMQEQGLRSLFPMHELSLFGLVELLPKWRHLKRRLSETVDNAIAARPDILITIDSPGFCFRLAQAVHGKIPGKTVHYVAPSVWAWRPGRAKKMATFVDHVLALLPFEPPYMKDAGMSCDFVGHPVVAESQPDNAAIDAFKNEHGITNGQRLVTILPGSRLGEIKRLSPIFFETAARLQKQIPGLCFAIPVAGEHVLEELQHQLDAAGLKAILLAPVSGSPDQTTLNKQLCFGASELALAASGTVSIELAAAGVPMVIGYKVNLISAWIIKRSMLAPSFTLVNLLTETMIVPEFFDKACNPDNLGREMTILLNDPKARAAQLDIGQQAIDALGRGGENPGVRAAKSVLAQLK